ncbi:MAG: radical SAM protein [Candidatus Roizmanbacteria bacterium]|nr:MAG: radical SAM protein [Candidatus Roizmanbacteria bacterium]
MKVVVGYPPIESGKGTPLLSQNRQFQYFNSPTYIYPMVPAYAASYLQEKGYKVYWMDGIAEKKTYEQWVNDLEQINPDYLLIETKAPVINTHWKQINDLKKRIPQIKIIIVGDHITYQPLESFENSKVDYAIIGGDYDFVIVNLLNHIYKKEKLEGGVYWRGKGKKIYNSGPASLKHNLDSLPFIDRDLTKWQLYAYENGNYKYTPGTYMYSGRDCWWNRCTFCIWDHTMNPPGKYRSFSAERLFAEVKHVVDKYGVKEIFDDAGTLFIGPKLKKFCQLLIENGYSKKVVYGCNMRFNAVTQEYYDLMKKANFRFILYGMESGNQKTLDKLDKGTKEIDAINGPRMAKKAGLEPHVTIMLGYPWESFEDAKRTIEIAKYAFKKGYYDTMQATIVIPYPGTPLYKEAKEKGWLLTENYEDFDMRKPVMKIPFPEEKLLELEQELYSAFMTPQYVARKIMEIRSVHDFMYLFYMAKKLIGHLLDFDPDQKKAKLSSLIFWKNAGAKLFKHFFSPKTSVDSEKDCIKI